MRCRDRVTSMHAAASSADDPVNVKRSNQQPKIENARHAEPQKSTRLIWSVAALLCWTVSSSGLILLNKELMVSYDFPYPMALTASGQFSSYLGGEQMS